MPNKYYLLKLLIVIALLAPTVLLAQLPPPPIGVKKMRTIDPDSFDRIVATPADIANYLVARPKFGDTTGKTGMLADIIRIAKRNVYLGFRDTYDEALVHSEEFYARKHMVDKILVVKHQRKLYLQKNGKNIRSFPIALGPNPVGQKQREGDGRTPEGVYTLDWQKHDNKALFHSFHISYPNAADMERAKQLGLKAGSNIMIHGTSAGKKKSKDWTNGCIALTNADMAVFRTIVFQDTKIEIVK